MVKNKQIVNNLIINNGKEKTWKISKTTDKNFKISEYGGLTFKGTINDVKNWIEKVFNPKDYQINDFYNNVIILV